MEKHRRSIRLKEYDYAQPGAYFVTLAAWNHETLFGEVVEDQMSLNHFGLIAQGELQRLPLRFPTIQIDEYVIMPNHVHLILWILAENPESVGASRDSAKVSSDQLMASPIPASGARLQEMESNSKCDSASPLQDVSSQVHSFLPSPDSVGARRDSAKVSSDQLLASPIPTSRARLQEMGSNSERDSASPLRGPSVGALGIYIGAYKSSVARLINNLRHTRGAPVWQRNYYEHVIRNDDDLNQTRRYIQSNPLHWQTDQDDLP